MNVKFLSNQKKTDLFIAESVSQIINLNAQVVPDLEDHPDLEEGPGHIEKERCSPQNVVTVEMIVKFLSNQKKTDLFIAESVSQIISKTSYLFRTNLKTTFFQNYFSQLNNSCLNWVYFGNLNYILEKIGSNKCKNH